MKRGVSGILAGVLFASAGLVGCQSGSSGGSGGTGSTVEGYWGNRTAGPASTPAPAPAAKPAPAPAAAAKPAPAPAQPAPAAKPAPAPTMMEGGMAKTMMYLPTGAANTSTIMVERFMPTEVIAGQNFDYMFKVTNLTGNNVSNVVLRDECQPTMNIVSSNPASNGAAPTLMWNLGDLGPQQSKTVTVTAKAAGAGNVGSCANVTWAQVLCQQVAVVQPALKVELTQTPEALICDPVCAKLRVCNTGSGMVRNAKVTYNMPAGWTTTDGKSGTVVLDAGNLAAGQCRDFDLCGKASKTGQNCGTASAAADGGLTASAPQACTTVKQPSITIKAECPPKTMMGRNLTFKFTVANKGDAACNATVVAPVPATTSFVSADNGGSAGGGGVTWNVGSLAPGASKVLTMVVKSTGAGTVTASATANCNCSAPASDQCSTSTEGVPDIGIRMEDDNGVVQVGTTHTFRYIVKNQGQTDLTNVKCVATMDAGLEYVSSTFPGAAPAGQRVEFRVGTLKPGQTASFDIVCKGIKEAELLILTETSSDQTKMVRADEHVNYVNP